MNKYQEGLNTFIRNVERHGFIGEGSNLDNARKNLQQLVDKEKTYKVKYAKNPLNEQIMGQCVCDNFISSDSNYCRHCGQKLDWKDSND